MTTTTNWEKEFDNRHLGCCGGDGCPYYVCRYDENTGNSVGTNHDEVLKDFIRSLLAQQRDEILDQVKESMAKLPRDSYGAYVIFDEDEFYSALRLSIKKKV